MNIQRVFLFEEQVCLFEYSRLSMVSTLKQIKRISSISNVTGLFRFFGLWTHAHALEVPHLEQT